MKLTKETLKRIIKEELNSIMREDQQKDVNAIIQSKIGGLETLVKQIAADLKSAMGTDLVPGDESMGEKFMQAHAARQIFKWYATNLPGLSGHKKDVFNFIEKSLPEPLTPEIWRALYTNDEEVLKRILQI